MERMQSAVIESPAAACRSSRKLGSATHALRRLTSSIKNAKKRVDAAARAVAPHSHLATKCGAAGMPSTRWHMVRERSHALRRA
eukprot:scaffold320905_cov45-Tisochrysis_lutea.AAC.1